MKGLRSYSYVCMCCKHNVLKAAVDWSQGTLTSFCAHSNIAIKLILHHKLHYADLWETYVSHWVWSLLPHVFNNDLITCHRAVCLTALGFFGRQMVRRDAKPVTQAVRACHVTRELKWHV